MQKLIDYFIQHPKQLSRSSGKFVRGERGGDLFRGIKLEDVTEAKRQAREYLNKNTQVLAKEVEHNLHKEELKSTITLDFEPKSIDELYNLHKIDKEKYIIKNYWSKLLPSGKFSSSVFSTKRKIEQDVHLQKDVILNVLKSNSKIVLNLHEERSDNLLEISLPDIHIGKLSHRDETGEDYDIKIAVERYKKAIVEILQNCNLDSVSRIVLPIGNDLIHVNSEDNMTVAGTPQDCDSRFHKMVKATKECLINVISTLSEIAPVDVVVVKGNHDATATFMIGEILDAYFHNNQNVSIDNKPTWRKYYRWQSVSIMYTHGDKEKHNDLGMIFATEQPHLWAETKHRFAKLGHLHKSKTTNYTPIDTAIGFQVQILPSLSATDEWHYGKGYIGLKQAKGFLYHPLKGEIAQYTYTV